MAAGVEERAEFAIEGVIVNDVLGHAVDLAAPPRRGPWGRSSRRLRAHPAKTAQGGAASFRKGDRKIGKGWASSHSWNRPPFVCSHRAKEVAAKSPSQIRSNQRLPLSLSQNWGQSRLERVKKCKFIMPARSASKNLAFRTSTNDVCDGGIHFRSPEKLRELIFSHVPVPVPPHRLSPGFLSDHRHCFVLDS